ncbi:MAG: alpha/beta hydrolase [Planctomycetes bacterium]|nr:alpha/beta hydrolase [Planctomycetota bacterium]
MCVTEKNPAFRHLLLVLGVICISQACCVGIWAGEEAQEPGIVIKQDIPYCDQKSEDEYEKSQCKLDAYLPKETDKPFPLLVWFHGGALKGGAKTSGLTTKLAKSFAARGIGVVVPEYRFSPKVKFPVYIQDSARAVKWTIDNAAELGALPNIFVGGHSAGGYISSLLAMDAHFLADAGVKIENIAGFIPMSGQTMTHFTVAGERGISSSVITADDAAPIHYLTEKTPPILLLIGDKDWPARLEENQYFLAALKKVGKNSNARLVVVKDRDHGGILKHSSEENDPACVAMTSFIRSGKLEEEPRETAPEK